ncbi:inovirus-type Gp2 protein [Halomonas aquamarina]|nr:inovirus-type Gp2 protein [Halomonas aquamarina]MDC8443670.1 inovirus-type Gp2 protein [Halomonas aquamarina]
MRKSIECYTRVLLARFTLKLPCDLALRTDIASSDRLSRFLLVIKSRIRRDTERWHLGHHAAVFHIASRAYTSPLHPPHFDIMLLIDGHLYPSAMSCNVEDNSLLAQIIESWATVLKMSPQEITTYVRYQPRKKGLCIHRLETGDDYRLPEACEQAISLSKKKGRQNDQAYRGLIMSKV